MHLPNSQQVIESVGWTRWLAAAALVLALALMIGRGTIRENLRDFDMPTPGQSAPPREAGPTTSLLIDLALMTPALLLLTQAAIDRRSVATVHGSHALLLAVALLAAASVAWSADRLNAAISAAHLLAAATACWAASQLFRSALNVRLLAAACASLLLIFVARGTLYRLVEVPDNLRYWLDHRDEQLAQHGWAAGSFEASQFEKKLRSGEMIGFSTSPNTFAAALVMMSIVVAGVVVQRVVDRDEYGWPIVLATPLLPAAWILTLTQSKAAVTAPFLAAAALLLIGRLSQRLRHRLRWIYFGGLLLAAMFVATVIAYGLSRGRLPSASLAFRWNYWVAAWHIFVAHPVRGIGWTSFGLRYLQARLPVAAEEVKDPHNFLVRAFVELGLVGGCIMLAWVARLGWEMLHVQPDGALPCHADRRTTIGSILSITTATLLIGLIASTDFTAASVNGSFILLQALERLLYFGLMLLAFAAVTLRSSVEPTLDDRPARWIYRAVAVAVAIFLIQNLIDFSLFEPGPMTAFAMIAGASIARFRRGWRLTLAGSRIVLLVCVIVTVAGLTAFWLPLQTAEARAASGDEAVRARDFFTAADAYKSAFDGFWIRNGDYAFREAYALEQAAAPASQVLEPLAAAIAANPLETQYYRNRAGYLLLQPSPDSRQIISDFETAERLDPNEVSLHREFADALLKLGQSVRAREELREALRYNDLLNPDEPKRLSPQTVDEVREQISRIGT